MNEIKCFDEELANITDKERQIEEMDYSKLSRPDAVMCWFQDPCYDLCEHGNTEIEREYLQAIDEVARRTGSSNFWLADYIWKLEKRLSKIEKTLEMVNGDLI